MKKRLLSAVLALVLCAYPAMAADFGTLTISSDREVIDDSVLYELAEADEPSTLTLRTPDGETGSLTFDGTEYHLQPCRTDRRIHLFGFVFRGRRKRLWSPLHRMVYGRFRHWAAHF